MNDINKKVLKDALDGIMRDTLKPITIGFTLLLVAYSATVRINHPNPAGFTLSHINMIVAAFVFSTYLALEKWSLPLKWAHPVGCFIAGLALFVSLAYLLLLQKSHFTYNLVLLIIGAGSILFSTRWLVVVILAIFAGWGGIVLILPPDPSLDFFGYVLFTATILSVVIHFARLHTYRRLEKMRLQDEMLKEERRQMIADLRDKKEELSLLNRSLEQKVEVRTAALQVEVNERKKAEIALEHQLKKLRDLGVRIQSLREEERLALARDMHDELGQHLTSLHLHLGFLEQKISNAEVKIELPELRSEITWMKSTALVTINKLKKLITELRPEMLDHLGLPDALEWQIEEFHKRTGLPCKVAIEVEDINLGNVEAIAVYRIFQESLTNIARHANAKNFWVNLTQSNENFYLEIKDDGKGFSIEKLKSSETFGLIGMKERAYVFGGEVKIDSAPGKGTTIQIRIPVPKPEIS